MIKVETVAKGLFSSSMAQLMAKVCGLIRNLLVATYFGTGFVVDNFNIASGIAVIIFFIVSDSFMYSSVPLLCKIKTKESKAFIRLSRSVVITSAIIGFVGMLISLGVFYFADSVIAPCYSPIEMKSLRITFSIMLPGCIAQLVRSAISAVANASSNFSLQAYSEALCSLLMFICICVFHGFSFALPISFSIGHVLAMLFMLWYAREIIFGNVTYRMLYIYRDFRPFIIGAAPYLAVCGIQPIFIFFEKRYGVMLGIGTLAALSYSLVVIDSASSLPQFGRVLFPLISTQPTNETFNIILKWISIYTIPIACFVNIFSQEIIVFFYKHGAVEPHDIMIISSMLMLLSPVIVIGPVGQCTFRFCYAVGSQRLLPVCRFFATLASVCWIISGHGNFDVAWLFSVYYVLFYVIDFIAHLVVLRLYSLRLNLNILMYVAKLFFVSIILSYVSYMLANSLFTTSVLVLILGGCVYIFAFVLIFVVLFKDDFSKQFVQKVIRSCLELRIH